MKLDELQAYCVGPGESLLGAVRCIDKNGAGVAVVVDPNFVLLGTISDGDIRRALLANISMDEPVSLILERKRTNSPYPKPVTARLSTEARELIRLMREREVSRIPLLDENGVLRDIAFFERLAPQSDLELEAMIMAGGYGTRLRPLTDYTPKPMLPVQGRPLLEHIVLQLRDLGIRKIYITTHYLAQQIVDHFGDGVSFDLSIDYVHEDTPMGTGGAVGMLPPLTKPLLLINGDILTQTNFLAMYAFHKEHNADMTVAVRHFSMNVPYGVVDCQDNSVCSLREKPIYQFLINAGMYILSPSVNTFIPHGQPFNITDLLQKLIYNQSCVASFLVYEYWLDIGHHEDYKLAQTHSL